jgi:hypothetical protein
VAATLLAHRHDELARAHDTGSGLGTSTSHREAAELAMATALGVPTRLTRQVPLPGADSGPAPRHRVVWSRDTDGVRPIRVVTPLLPGRGGRPTSVMASGVGLLVAAVVLRSGLGEVDDAAIIARLRGTTPEAVGSIDQVLDVARLVALAPLLLGIVLAVAGTVDLRARRVTVGRVVDVRLPGDRSVGDRAARALSGTRTSGTLIVEMAVDDGTTDRVRSWRVDAGTAAPVGSMVEVRHTPVLGRVVSVRPAMGSGDPVVETAAAGRS